MNDATTDLTVRDDPMGNDDREGPLPATAESADQLSTGDVRVDDAVARLGDLDGRELDQHAEIFDDIHRALGSVLDGTSEGDPAGQ